MIPCTKIYSRFLAKIEDFKLADFSEDDVFDLETEWLHSAISKPRVRRLFNNLSFDTEHVIFQLRYSIDKEADENFVIEILVLGMVIEWLQPKVDSILYTAPMIGGKEEKKIFDNYKEMKNRLSDMKTEQNKMIRDYGYFNNSYLKKR